MDASHSHTSSGIKDMDGHWLLTENCHRQYAGQITWNHRRHSKGNIFIGLVSSECSCRWLIWSHQHSTRYNDSRSFYTVGTTNLKLNALDYWGPRGQNIVDEWYVSKRLTVSFVISSICYPSPLPVQSHTSRCNHLHCTLSCLDIALTDSLSFSWLHHSQFTFTDMIITDSMLHTKQVTGDWTGNEPW